MTRERQAAWSISWAGRDVTRDLSELLVSATYSDSLEAEGATCELVFVNDGRWLSDWAPSAGQRIELGMGWLGEGVTLRPGPLEIDECEVSPTTCTVSAISSRATRLRTRASRAYDGRTLRQVVSAMADELGLRLVGTPPAVQYPRITRLRETPLAFLRRLGAAHGCVVAIRDDQLVFVDRDELGSERLPAVSRHEMLDYRFRWRSLTRYSSCVVTSHDKATGELVEGEATDSSVEGGDVLRIRSTAVKGDALTARARAALRRANRAMATGECELEGEPSYLAGVALDVADAGTFDGAWLIERASHQLDAGSGWRSSMELSRV